MNLGTQKIIFCDIVLIFISKNLSKAKKKSSKTNTMFGKNGARMSNCYIGVRADKALAIIGEKGPLRMSSLLDALGIRTKVAASFKATVQKLVNAWIMSVTDDHDTLVSLTDQKYADPAVALDEYRAYNSEKKAEKKTETKAVIIPPVKRSMIEDIAFGMAEQGALK